MPGIEQGMGFPEFATIVKESTTDELTERFWEPGYDPSAHLAPLAERHFNPDATQAAWLEELKANVEEYQWVHDRLEDPLSRDTLMSIMRYRLSWNGEDLAHVQEGPKYFDWSLLRRPANAVYVDGGAYDGGSVINFADMYGLDYSAIHGFEPFPSSYRKLVENCGDMRDTTLVNKGLWDESTELSYAGKGQSVTVATVGSIANPDGSFETISLDEHLDEDPSIIKMDMEGAELKAIKGAYRAIRSGMPQLAICAYHLMGDLREIPRAITEISDDYTLSLRNYKTRGSAEIVLYARA